MVNRKVWQVLGVAGGVAGAAGTVVGVGVGVVRKRQRSAAHRRERGTPLSVGPAPSAGAAGVDSARTAPRAGAVRVDSVHTAPSAGAVRAEIVEPVAGQVSSVIADDGVRLSCEEFEAPGAVLTVVLVHGFALDRRTWKFQCRALTALADPPVRVVLYDQRSHGRSERAPRGTCTIDQLGHDLDTVLRALAATGPLVLVGHSMGGMTLMALAAQRPELFAERVAGVMLISASAGDSAGWGLLGTMLSPYNPLTWGVGLLARARPKIVEGIRRAAGDVIWSITRSVAYGDPSVDAGLVDLVDDMIGSNTVDALSDFVDTLGSHDRIAALPALAGCEVVVAAGDVDRLIPFAHSERIAAELPDATLLLLPGVGHLPMLEQPAVIDEALTELIRRSLIRRSLGRTVPASDDVAPAAVLGWDRELVLPTAEDTEALGAALAAELSAGDLVVLSGPLGAGKTVLVRGIGRGLGVAGSITSPTFVIAREHRPLPGGAGVPLVHVDAYRLGLGGADVGAELDDLDLDTDLAQSVVVVEWGEGVAERLAARHVLIRLERRPDDVRVATVHRVSASDRR